MGYKLDKLEGLTTKELQPIKEWVHNLVKLDDVFKNNGLVKFWYHYLSIESPDL